MKKITNVISVFDNGEVWPHGTPVFPEIQDRGGSKMVAKRWNYGGQSFELPMVGDEAYSIIDVLQDETGFVVMRQYDVPEAAILNGDASVRFLLKPLINVRGFDKQRLSLIEELEIKNAFHSGVIIDSYKPTAMFHYKTPRKDVLEFFGDDGYGDCYYSYDSSTGELVSTQAYPRRS